ncbi:hypothetical protein [Acinetobacter sp.]|uniref:hypothetical protein n=1 Tax=Acinetobacter sp. TaxID=472 RepID=UPI0035B32544
MDIQRDEAFEEAYSKICNPVIARPYPRNGNGEYFYKEIHEAHLMWQEAHAQAPEANALLSTLDAVQKLGSGDFVLVPVIDIELAIEALDEAGEGESKYYAGCADGLRKALESLEKNNGN